ncbi:hypothetical protein FACS1894123_06410 [Bacteroidia bacterium]|nr:hypothetical protein FACS1894123_06410 [Bacteroidia bacterium]
MKKYIILLVCLFVSLFYANAQTSRNPVNGNRLTAADPLEINVGSKNAAFTYTDTQNTNSSNFGNNYGRTTNEVFYKLTLTTAMEITMSHCNSAVSDTYMYLLDAYKNLIVSNDDYSGEGKCSNTYHSRIKQQLQGGTYYVVSEGYSANGNITTNITANIIGSVVSPEINLGSKNAPFTYTNTQNTANFGNIYGKNTNEVFYKFTLTTAMEITMSHCNSAVSDTYMYLLDAYKNLIVSNDDYSGEGKCSNTYHSCIKIQLPAGTYYVVSEGYSANGNITTNITGTIASTIVDLGSRSAAFTYTHTQNTSNLNNSYGQTTNEVFYKLTLTTAMEITVSHCNSAVSDTYMYLLDASKNLIISNDDYSGEGKCSNTYHSYIKRQLAVGTYYIVSEGYSANGNITTNITGNVTSPEIDLGSKSTAFTYTNTQNTANFSSNYGRTTNEVFYKFTLTTALEVTISHCNSAVSDTYMYLLDASKNLIATNDNYSGEGQCSNTNHSYIKRQLAAGTYYVVSEGYSANGNITTNITGNVPEALVTDIGSKSVSFAYSNTQNTANSANYYTTRSTNDVTYKFTITQTMLVFISHEGSDVLNTCVYLLNASKSLLNSNNNTRASLRVQLSAGTYFVVSEGYSANGNITTTVQGTIPDPAPIQAQASQNQNYIKTRTYASENGNSYLDQVQYYDGLGRPNQQVQVGVTPNRQDLITIQEYDPIGRESKTWLPIPKTNNGAFYSGNIVADSKTAYNNDNYAYAEPQYEASPLNRREKQFGPGQAWRTANRPVKTGYKTNNSNDCAKYSISENNLVRSNYYDANTLSVTQITDEDNKISYEYKDKLDRVVLQRQMDGSTAHNTYYIYDDFGNLRFVLPPLAADATPNGTYTETSAPVKDYAYQYRYDNRNRCTWKRLPGCEPVSYMYDTADRVIFTQDGELRNSSNRWRFSIPDVFGRIVLEGICTSPSNSGVAKAEYQTSPSGTFASYGYTLSGISLALVQMLQVNYYDNYQFKSLSQHINNSTQYNYATPIGFENRRYGGDTGYSAKGLLTGSIAFLLDNSTPLRSTYYYDIKGRLIVSISQNHLNGFDKEYTNYSFTGQPTWNLKIHTATGKPDIRETHRYYYDHADRLTHTEYNIGNETDVTLTALQYDNLGRLTQKKLHGGKETISYAYNIRNWLSTVNSARFGENLYYETSVAGSTAYYNGNISAMILPPVSGVTSLSRGYTYEYDGMSRLKKARYVENNSAKESFTEEYGYDKQGNMLNLKRNALLTPTASTYTLVDNLTMEHTGNQLKKVTDAVTTAAASTIGFVKPGGSAANEYLYNKNGAISQDFNRSIAGITYNSLNLPQRIQFMYGHNTQYSYDASGVKRKVTHQTVTSNLNVPLGTTNYTPTSSQIQNTLITDYCGNIVYENGSLRYIQNEEGYVTKSGNNYIFNYYLKDHLGNNRVVIDVSSGSNPARVQATDYYAFGLPYAFGTAPERQPYKFGGKELDEMHGLKWYDFEARQKDAVLPMFTTIDPMAEKYYSVSPYAYCFNNPVRLVDITGEEPTVYEAALMSRHVYHGSGKLAGGWVVSSRQVANVTYSNPTNGFKSNLYERTISNGVTEYAYVTAGTDLPSAKDWKNNFIQLSGNSGQYTQSVNNAKVLTRNLDEAELTFTGHSLGGGLAAANALATGKNATTFNAAALSQATKDSKGLNNSASIFNVVVKGEIVNHLQSLVGLKLEGGQYELTAFYWPGRIGDIQRIKNHSMDVIIDKLEKKDNEWKHHERK